MYIILYTITILKKYFDKFDKIKSILIDAFILIISYIAHYIVFK